MSAPSVVLRVAEQHYALPALMVQEMLALPQLTRVPHQSAATRGVMNLRGRVVPVRDMRCLTGHHSLAQEIEQFSLDQRERDHIEWVAALDHSVRTKDPFTKARDAHDCAFGQWYYNFHADNAMLAAVLARFEEPHRRLHEAAHEACNLVHSGQEDEALAVVERVRVNELAQLRAIFAATREALADAMREVAVVVNHPTGLIAFSVDAVEAVEDLRDIDADNACESHISDGLVAGYRRRASQDGLVLMLDAEPEAALFAD